MNRFLSGKILFALIIGLVIIAGSFTASRWNKIWPSRAKNTENTATKQMGSINLEELVQKDSDHDGVPDWEESLWGTDPNNSDTFGNKLGDRAEIDKKKAALRQDASQSYGKNQIAAQDDSNLTQTDIFARQYFTAILALRQAGNDSPEAIQELNLQVLKNIQEQGKIIKYYSTSDIHMVATATSTIEKYAKDMGGVIAKYENSGLGEELPIIAFAVDNNNPKALSGATKNSVIYSDMKEEIMKIDVPGILASSHLSLANALKNTAESLSNMDTIWKDPITGLAKVALYRNSTESFVVALNSIENYLKNRGIVISK